MTPLLRQALRALLVACACALVVPLSAPAAIATTPCWKTLLNEWYGGKIAHIYPIPCYHSAISHLPQDIQVYSSARDDITRALQLAIQHESHPSAPVPTVKSSGPRIPSTTTTPGRATPSSPIPSALNASSPGGATSFPLPLIILGGLAIVLLAAGGVGLIIRRRQGGSGPGPA